MQQSPFDGQVLNATLLRIVMAPCPYDVCMKYDRRCFSLIVHFSAGTGLIPDDFEDLRTDAVPWTFSLCSELDA